MRRLADAALADLSRDFEALYTAFGHPSIAPEKLLQAFYGIRSEQQLMEWLDFDLLFRWFVGLGVDDAVWDHSTFSKNRDRLLEGEIATKFLTALLARPDVKRLLSTENFSVDSTLIEAWASIESFRRKDGGDQSSPCPPKIEGGAGNDLRRLGRPFPEPRFQPSAHPVRSLNLESQECHQICE